MIFFFIKRTTVVETRQKHECLIIDEWCFKQQPVLNPQDYLPQQVFHFLFEHQHKNSKTLNTWRSAIASIYKQNHPIKTSVAEVPMIKDFFATKRNTEEKMLTEEQLPTWDTNMTIKYI
ncbi:hypothetical protein K501DRAFT_180905 [Backusella circina FSU 941]|nr:hypothetical protein K501DRAFT_180905 [Backusella circina FSU 941]